MSNQTPTPAPDLAAIIANERNKGICIAPDLCDCNPIWKTDSCKCREILLAAASRPAPPVADGEVAKCVADARRYWAQVKHGNGGSDNELAKVEAAFDLLLSLSSRLAAAEARAEQADRERENWKAIAANEDPLAKALMRDRAAAESACTALRERVGALTEALEFYADPGTYFAIGIFPDNPAGEFVDDFSETDDGFKPGKRARAALSASPVPQPAPATAMPEWIAKEVALKRRMMKACKELDQSTCIDCIRDAAFVEAAEAHYAPPAWAKEGRNERHHCYLQVLPVRLSGCLYRHE